MRSPGSDLRRLLPAAVIAVLAFVGISSCDHGDDGDGGAAADRSAQPAPRPAGTPLASLDTSRMVVARASFCDRVGPTAVEAALDSHEYDDASYSNGDRVPLTADVKDVAHEYSCSWTAPDGTRAEAWVFAPPVTRSEARRLGRAELRPGCARTHDRGFGWPSMATSCGHRATGGGTQLGYHGLFGDAWLSCTLTAPKGPEPPDLTERADHWCAAVVQATSG